MAPPIVPDPGSERVTPIGYMRSCFPEKFGTPRQAGLVSAAAGTVVLTPPFCAPEMIRGLDGYSHIWVIFLFHGTADQPWRPTVRPPRLGGNRRVGVLATRSNFRPNPIGMSAVRLAGIHCRPDGIDIAVTGIDIIDGTPVLDIKPYLPYSDRIEDATAPMAPERPPADTVTFATAADRALARLETAGYPAIRALVSDLLALDPRPAYDAGRRPQKTYGMRIYDLNVKWRRENGGSRVLEVTRSAAGASGAPAAPVEFSP